ncbi:Peroxidase [Araneus ventricosus]|uniref:Peroxidase n=1 Tax=Araneus ventricosus TaxID=182803 RepID=A0A4Y2SYN4_ARAVE|nr:Peroxidase [Araneus ventricosus]
MPGVSYGKDLAATNIQRGRDHGIGPYVEIVKFCSERTINITSFDDLVELEMMPVENVQLLKQLYESVEDVDMWVGMQLENRMPGSIVGPSAVCVSAKQFYFAQKGDRLFFNHEGLLAPFTADQRSTIKNCSLGRILCDNTDIGKIPKNQFLLPSTDNPLVSCEKIPKINLSFWKENKSAASMS